HAKLRDYERAGVREYIVRDLRGKAVHWFALTNGRLEPHPPDPDGLFRSRVFPGLWLDPAALLSGNHVEVVGALQGGLASAEHAAFVAKLEQRRTEGAARS
ncbi:MAG: Uma2 family endonuclease, partial [Isosphaeraceae bacterium]